jgi:uncharacterized alpha/beta hydrolase family protein
MDEERAIRLAERVVKLLKRGNAIIEKTAVLAREEKEILKRMDVEELEPIIKEQEQQRDEFFLATQKLEKLMKDLGSSLGLPNFNLKSFYRGEFKKTDIPQGKTIYELLTKQVSLREEILKLSKENQMIIEENAKKLAQELKSIEKARHARKSYLTDGIEKEGVFFDEKS